jgi:CRISPR-associated protein Csb2
MLAIEVTFLTGRYVATAYNTRSESEWPPHPARLFSALVATHAANRDFLPDAAIERGVLEWLEQQGAPSIIASEAARREIVTVFVPVNDVALTNVDDEALALEDARATLAAAESARDPRGLKKADAAVRKAAHAFDKAVANAIEVPSRTVESRYGSRLLPDQRGRQPRTFPSVTPVDPCVTYVWPDAMPSNEQRLHLDQLLARVVRLGHSSSLVSMRVVDPSSATPTWVPRSDGEASLRTVEKGQLAALERAFGRHHEIEPRVMPAVTQMYSRSLPKSTAAIAPSVFSDEWLVLRRVGGPNLPMTAAAGIARAMRKTLMSYADDPIPEVVSGHATDGSPSQAVHLAIVPLPFVGHAHASGVVLGIALILPRAATLVERRTVYGAVARWEAMFRQEDEDAPAVKLNLGAAGELRLERVEGGTVQTTLRAEIWCGPSKTWLSVTPVALDRNPGDLRSRDNEKLHAALRGAEETIARGCVRIGLPEPAAVEILPAAPWAGAAKARHYPPYPADADRTRRVLTHARLVFNDSVAGPVLVGAGRYGGLGLFRPEVSS